MLKNCVNSLVGHDEIIILANDGLGYGASCNLGMRMARGDFIILANNDCLLKSGNLADLADKDFITVPVVDPAPKDGLPRPFFCVPRDIYEYIYESSGDFYDERYEGGYWEDDDLHRRMEQLGINSRLAESVLVSHLHGGGNTMKQLGEQYHYDTNKEKYDQRWS
jgi:GT2 family glycosyltransferase